MNQITKYENAIGDIMLVINEDYIIIDKQSLAPSCYIYDEPTFKRYIDGGFHLSKDNSDLALVGICSCGMKIYENNRIKVRDYFECPHCKKANTRNDFMKL